MAVVLWLTLRSHYRRKRASAQPRIAVMTRFRLNVNLPHIPHPVPEDHAIDTIVPEVYKSLPVIVPKLIVPDPRLRPVASPGLLC